jgi:hypothetical protein
MATSHAADQPARSRALPRLSERGSLGSWFYGVLLLLGGYLLLEFVAPTPIAVWARIYIAGAFGGICFELMRNHWRLEMPSGSPAGRRSAEPLFAPLGPLDDLGFLGRMITGAVAAPTFIAIVATLDTSEAQQADLSGYLETLATRGDTLAWGVAPGFAALAVWTLLEQFIQARGAVANTRLDTVKKDVALIHAKAERALAEGSNGAGNGAVLNDTVKNQLQEIIGVADAVRTDPQPQGDLSHG